MCLCAAASATTATGRAGPSATAACQADQYWMGQALAEAASAADEGVVPVGAVIVRDGAVLATGANAIEKQQDPTAHAEILAIRGAVAATKARRLLDATLYATLEPCAMCAGAVVLARIPRLVYGAGDPKSGACGSLRNVVQDERLNHCCTVVGGVLEGECAELLRRFFARLRSGAE